MLPPKQGEIKYSLLSSQAFALKESISQIIRNELEPLKSLIECSSKEIDVRLLKLEDRLQIALDPHSSPKAQTTCIEENNAKHLVSTDTDSKKIAGIGIIRERIRVQSFCRCFSREYHGRKNLLISSKKEIRMGYKKWRAKSEHDHVASDECITAIITGY
jgi:hypothetical protein